MGQGYLGGIGPRCRSTLVLELLSAYCPGKKKELLRGLEKVFEYLSIEFRIPLTDFPDVNETRKKLAKYFDHFPP